MNNKSYLFLGCMNSMPFMYAMELKKRGSNVFFVVDSNQKDKLNRPENFYNEITYPYPKWIIEILIPSQILVSIFPRLFYFFIKVILYSKSIDKYDTVVLNGFFVSLSPYFSNKKNIICLSHGSDLDSWANISLINSLISQFHNRSIFKYLPNFISKNLINIVVRNQYNGFRFAKKLLYFPSGFNKNGDEVIYKLSNYGVKHVELFGCPFGHLLNFNRNFKVNKDKLVIFSGVRFIFKTFPEGNTGYNKGNDKIIRAIASYYEFNSNIEVHFVNKGEDSLEAKNLCNELGLNEIIIWHEEMPFNELICLYENADICFDQVGSNWLGAIGYYALWFGKPLIANVSHEINSGVWPKDNPVCNANSEIEIVNWLHFLSNYENRLKVSNDSKYFADTFLSFSRTVDSLFCN